MKAMRRHHHGFTMIELMVSLALGMLVAAAATQLLVTNAVSFTAQRGITDVQDNGRFAMDFISRDIRPAGLKPANTYDNQYPPIVVDTSQMPGASAGVLTMNAVPSTGLGASDQLLVQRLTFVDTVDCEGNVVEANRYVVSRYFLRADPATNADSALACDGGFHDESVLSNVGDAGVVLLGGVENMQVLLGVGNAGYPERFYRPDEYALLALPRPRVIAVRVGALVVSADRTQQVAALPDLNVLDELVEDLPNDGRIRRVFVTSIALRNER
jgi:type IV pilus assembly protein PilW